ncbi:MAG: AMP-binding protein [Acidimicrobiales bacterium]
MTQGPDIAVWIDRWADHRPDATAVEFEGKSSTYRQLSDQIAAAAAWLHHAGITHGDRVAYLGPNRPEILELVFGCARIGAIYLPLNSRLAPAEHAWILSDAEPALLIEDPEFGDHVDQTLVVNAGTNAALPARAALGAASAPWHDSRYVAAAGAETPRIGSPTDALLLAYTSGTTGRPKGAVLDQTALAANAVNGAHAHDLTSADRVLTLLPLFHVGGLNIQTLPALHAGAAVMIHRAFDPGRWLEDVEAWRPTLSLLVPATLAAVSQHPRFATADLSSLRGLMTGSSTVPVAILKPYLDRGIPVGQIYGSTETAPTAIYLRLEDSFEHPLSCGKPATHCDVRIVDAAGADVVPGESGELWVSGPNILREYWRNPVATAEALTDGWFHTGDIAHVDAQGFFHIDDRSKDVIISGGENIYPAEVENVLADSRLIAEAVVIGRPDERWGEVPIIVAVAATVDAVDTEALLDHFTGRLARFKIPKDVVWVEELPRNAMGKVLKHVLRSSQL